MQQGHDTVGMTAGAKTKPIGQHAEQQMPQRVVLIETLLIMTVYSMTTALQAVLSRRAASASCHGLNEATRHSVEFMPTCLSSQR